MNRLLPLLALAALPILGPSAQAQGAANQGAVTPNTGNQSTVTLTCQGSIVGRNLAANISVPAGATCLLNDTMVTGNVLLGRGATLNVRNTNIQGRLTTAAGYRHLNVQGSIVQGELRAEGGGSVNLNDSQVMGHMRVSGNTGPVRLAHATLNQNLECLNNRAAPTGTWLRVDGKQLGQCSRL